MQQFFPVNVTLEVTNKCNLRCKHCFRASGEMLLNELSFEEIDALFTELTQMDTAEIDLSGGEPLIRQDILKIVDSAVSHNFIVTLTTNGTLIDKDFAKKLSALPIGKVQVSLDGNRSCHDYLRGKGTYERALHGITLLAEQGIRVVVHMVVIHLSFSTIQDTISRAIEVGASGFGLAAFLPAGRGLIHQRELLPTAEDLMRFPFILTQAIEKYGSKISLYSSPLGLFDAQAYKDIREKEAQLCSCGKYLMFVRANGIVSPCDFDLFYAGNIRERPVSKIWEDAKIFKTFRDFDPNFLKGSCGECRDKELCGGGCRALAVIHSGDFYGQSVICPRIIVNKEK